MKNIIWILCDSARNYKTNADDRGKLDVMDSFAEDSIDFRNVVTSAPSTIMSLSSMMTALPGPLQALDYNGFVYNTEILSLPQILRNSGYKTYGLFSWSDGDDFLMDIYGDDCSDLRSGARLNKRGTQISNDEQLATFYKFLNSEKVNDDFFFWLHLDCRNDYNLSEKVEQVFDELKSKNLYDDSIIVLGSDHGYPDPSRNIPFEEMRRYGHDLLMYDDNILTPQILKLPGVEPKTYKETISTLDLSLTILDYLGLYTQSHKNSIEKINFSGKSHWENIKNNYEIDERIFRVDNRFIFQNQSATALRSNNYKYIESFYKPDGEFFDLLNDPYEQVNLINSVEHKSIINEYKRIIDEDNDFILEYHAKNLSEKLSKIFDQNKGFILIGDFNENVIKVFQKIFYGINYFDQGSLDKKLYKSIAIYASKNVSENPNILSFPVSKDHKINTEIVKLVKNFTDKGKGIFYLDYNFNIIDRPKHWIYNITGKPVQYYHAFVRDPKTAWVNFKIDVVKIFKYIFNK